MISRGYTGLLSGPERPWLDRSWELLDTAVQPYIRLYTGIPRVYTGNTGCTAVYSHSGCTRLYTGFDGNAAAQLPVP